MRISDWSSDVCSSDLSLDDWRHVLDVNLTAAFVASQRFARRAERGKIINVISEFATFGGPMVVGYTASKHGLLGLTKTLAIDKLGRASCRERVVKYV